MENNQDNKELRTLAELKELNKEIKSAIWYRCTPQKEAAEQIGCTKEYLNTCLNSDKLMSFEMLEKVQTNFLDN